MNDDPTPKPRLELDTELIADLETDGDDVVGGQYTAGGGSIVRTLSCPTRGVHGGEGLNAGC